MKVHVYTFLFLLVSLSLSAQETVLDFEDAGLELNQYDDGIDNNTGLFTFSGVDFSNEIDQEFNYWTSGWSISTMQDSTTNSFTNLYAAYPFGGNNESLTYMTGQRTSTISFADGLNRQVNSLAVTNASWALLVMRDGDPGGFSKTFGGDTGDDPDYFFLTIKGYDNQSNLTDSIDFYLADYRFDDNSQDYIVNTWETIDLSSLGAVNSLEFILSSSDANELGLLTPAYYCIDDLKFESTSSTSALSMKKLSLYPNPASEFVYIENASNKEALVQIFDINGSLVYDAIHEQDKIELDIESLVSGVYQVIVKDEEASYNQKLIIQ